MKKTSWLYVFIACFLASCSSIQSFTFDELIPAETSFPEQLATVAVVNNMVAIPDAGFLGGRWKGCFRNVGRRFGGQPLFPSDNHL